MISATFFSFSFIIFYVFSNLISEFFVNPNKYSNDFLFIQFYLLFFSLLLLVVWLFFKTYFNV